MKVVVEATTTNDTYVKTTGYNSSCCGDDCKLKCKKCPPMTD